MEQSYTILVVDDDTVQLTILEKLLTHEGYLVFLADSGASAISMIKNGLKPDLMLLDITMPDMDGYHVYRSVNEICSIPTIFLTAALDCTSELTGLKLGAIDYITKPFEFDILLARINNHLEIINTIKVHDKTNIIMFDDKKLASMSKLLTGAELSVAKLMALGLTNREIADKLSYSYTYVKKLAYRIFDKTGISHRNEIRPYFF